MPVMAIKKPVYPKMYRLKHSHEKNYAVGGGVEPPRGS